MISLQGHDVDASWSSRISIGQHVRCDVLQNATRSADKRIAANSSIVRNGNRTGKRRMMIDVNVTAQQSAVADDHVVCNSAIVSDVYAAHEVTIAADSRVSIFFGRRAIDRDAFADNVSVSDNDLRFVATVAGILGRTANDCVGRDNVVFADLHIAIDRDVVHQNGSATDFCFGTDDTEVADFNIVCDLSSRIDDCQIGYFR